MSISTDFTLIASCHQRHHISVATLLRNALQQVYDEFAIDEVASEWRDDGCVHQTIKVRLFADSFGAVRILEGVYDTLKKEQHLRFEMHVTRLEIY